MTLVAPRIVNDVLYVSRITRHDCRFSRRCGILGDVGVSLCVAGATFGDVGVSLFVAGAASGEIWIDSRSAKCCNFQTKRVAEGGKVSSPNRRVQFCNFMLGS